MNKHLLIPGCDKTTNQPIQVKKTKNIDNLNVSWGRFKREEYGLNITVAKNSETDA